MTLNEGVYVVQMCAGFDRSGEGSATAIVPLSCRFSENQTVATKWVTELRRRDGKFAHPSHPLWTRLDPCFNAAVVSALLVEAHRG